MRALPGHCLQVQIGAREDDVISRTPLLMLFDSPTSLPAADSWDEDVVEVRGTPVRAARAEASFSARSASARATAIS